MRDRFDDALPTEHGLQNVRFLMQQQVQQLETLAHAGRDTGDALHLLRRLMETEIALRARSQLAGAVSTPRVASA